MKIAIVGGGPAGSTAARHLARLDHHVTIFDPSHPREKPCGGGFGLRAHHQFPPGVSQQLQKSVIHSAELRAAAGRSVAIELTQPLYVASRSELDRALLDAAQQEGAHLAKERIVGFNPGATPTLCLSSGPSRTYDYVIGADGARSIIGRSVGQVRAREDLTQTLGYYPRGEFPPRITVQFLGEGNGYLWAFPRPDHVSLGIGCDLGSWTSKDLWRRLDQFAMDVYGDIDLEKAKRFSALIPSFREDALARLVAEGQGWALCGDALGLVDPITREGIISAIETARGLAGALSEGVTPGRYTRFVQTEILPEIRRATHLKTRFFRPQFTELMVEYAERSEAIRLILSDLVSGHISYHRLKQSLLMGAFPVAVDYMFRKLGRRIAGRSHRHTRTNGS